MNDWLQLLRVSNAPTCVTNVLVGCAIGIASLPPDFPGPFIDPGAVVLVLASVFGFYFGGMALNDVLDVERDRASGAPRPIARGRIGRTPAAILSILLLSAGLVCAGLAAGMPGVLAGAGLLTCIVVYDCWHGSTWPAVVLMGLCRGLVYLLAALTVTTALDATLNLTLLLVLGGGLMLHTAIVTGIARTERTEAAPASWALPLLPLAPCGALFLLGGVELWATAVFGIVLALWLGRIVSLLRSTPPRVIPAVLAGLSGIALLDAFYLAMLGWAVLSLLCVACFALTALAHRSIAGT